MADYGISGQLFKTTMEPLSYIWIDRAFLVRPHTNIDLIVGVAQNVINRELEELFGTK